ncbi:hypothetical protein [Spongiibacter marinus]|uniref:hypothetical protein n=1 Tax=Spongiibacter marinus TaxID=354246 RepID=UPI00195FA691|nr:hypothetical protein [Spongiibacter marinus]MBM7423853.1 hypothetical protein [Spongiibacter marinus]
MKKLLIAILIWLPAYSQADENADLVENFCYALQAMALCDGISMRVDTEKKLEAKVGGPLRGRDSKYNGVCMAGISNAFDDEQKGLCEKAWNQFGCFGSVEPKLLQKSSYGRSDHVLCEYE